MPKSPELSPKPDQNEILAMELFKQLQSDPYRFTEFRKYIQNVDAGYLPELDRFVIDCSKVGAETCRSLSMNFNDFLRQSESVETSNVAIIMGRRIKPDLADQISTQWHQSLIDWENRNQK